MSDHINPPRASEAVDISSTDHTFTLKSITSIFVGTGGDVVATLAGDLTARTYKNLPNAYYLLGCFVSVTKIGTTAGDMVGVTGLANGGSGV